MHQDALHLRTRIALLQILHQGRQQRIVGRAAGQLKVDAVFLHRRAGRFHHEFIAAMQLCSSLP